MDWWNMHDTVKRLWYNIICKYFEHSQSRVRFTEIVLF